MEHKIGIADYKITTNKGDKLITVGLGSCVGVCLYDISQNVYGLIHIMLPDSNKAKTQGNLAKFADTGIKLLIEEMIKKGARKGLLKAKIAGGAQMFNFNDNKMNEFMDVGKKNVLATEQTLKENGVPIIAKEVGGNFGRTIEFDTETCNIKIFTAKGHDKII